MRFFIVFILFTNICFSQGYPEDTLWFNEEGHLKDTFVVENIYFELAQADLITYPEKENQTLYWDSSRVELVYHTLDSLSLQIQKDGGKFKVWVHTDCRGSDHCCSRPSEARAKTVYYYLIEKGVNPESLMYAGAGEEIPRIYKGNTSLSCEYIEKQSSAYEKEWMHSLNRRVEIIRIE